MKMAMGFLMLLLSGCANSGDAQRGAGANLKPPAYTIDSRSGCLARICTGMPEAELVGLHYPFSRKTVVLEGDEYAWIVVSVKDGFAVDVLLDAGKVERFSTTSHYVSDEHGIGVGATLADLKRAYGSGTLLVGDEDGWFANFVNGTKVVFELDQEVLARECLGSVNLSCKHEMNARVLRIVVHTGAAFAHE